MASTSKAGLPLPEWNISSIKNKQRRTEMYREIKKKKRKAKLEEKKRKIQEAKAKGEKAPPKQIPKTLENMRVPDETMVNPQDEEVMADEAAEMTWQSEPKVMITTCDRPSSRTNKLCKELKKIIPNSEVFYRRGLDLKKVIPQAVSRDFTDIVVINENMKIPNGLVVSHLPEGPTAHFRISNVRLSTEIKKADAMTSHRPEVILNNFNTRLGHSVGRLLANLFNTSPNHTGRRVVTFHNQRDFIFFRQHRYEFKNEKKVALKELGPRFTLKLRSLQKGTFDSKHGQYEWIHKRHEMETSRRKFFL